MNGADKLRLQIHIEYTFKIHYLSKKYFYLSQLHSTCMVLTVLLVL